MSGSQPTRRRKPTRRDLLIVIGRLQDIVGAIKAVDHDRNQNRADDKEPLFKKAFDLCVEARSYEPPIKDSGPWSQDV